MQPAVRERKPRSPGDTGILVVGLDRLLTQLAKCCKPVPPDPIRGFVTRGKGVSIHREDCSSLKRLSETHAERLIEASWGAQAGGSYPVEIAVTAMSRSLLPTRADSSEKAVSAFAPRRSSRSV